MNPKHGAARVGHICIAEMIRALLDGPKTVAELSELSGLSQYTVRRYVREMKKRKAAHIAAWEEDTAGRVTAASYRLGEGKDATRPARPRDNATRMRQYRQRQKQVALLGALAGSMPMHAARTCSVAADRQPHSASE